MVLVNSKHVLTICHYISHGRFIPYNHRILEVLRLGFQGFFFCIKPWSADFRDVKTITVITQNIQVFCCVGNCVFFHKVSPIVGNLLAILIESSNNKTRSVIIIISSHTFRNIYFPYITVTSLIQHIT